MDGMIAALQSKEVSGGFFAGGVVFAVCSVELFRLWLKRGTDRKGRPAGIAVGAGLGLVFLVMAGSGIVANMIVGRVTFLGLGLLLTGLASLGLLIDLMVRTHGADDEELRRLAAHDL